MIENHINVANWRYEYVKPALHSFPGRIYPLQGKLMDKDLNAECRQKKCAYGITQNGSPHAANNCSLC